MTLALRLPRGVLALGLAALLTACATPQRMPGTDLWSGRLALTIEGRQDQSIAGGFELRGAPAAGELTLLTPLGSTAAVLAWAPGEATLRSGGEVRRFASLEALAVEATGANLPIAALFDWLAGTPTPVAGWQVDVSQAAQGRLRARRDAPLPAAELRVAFER